MENFISAQDRKCRLAFDKILEISPKDLKIQDQYDRYKIWEANTGAGHTGQTYTKSLDYRLREAQQYRDQIVDVLKQLHQYLADAESYVSGKVGDDLSSSSDEVSEDEDLGMQSTVKWTLSDSEEDGDESSEKDSERRNSALPHLVATGLEWLDSDSRLKPTLASIEMAITYLYRIPVREPATYNRLKRYEKSDNGEFDMYLRFDQQFVRDAFPNANERIASRLGKLVTTRRRILRYRQLYNDDLQREAVNSGNTTRPQRSAHTVSDMSRNEPPVPDHDNQTEKQPSNLPKSSLKASTFRPKDPKPPSTDRLLSSAVSEADEASSVAPTIVEGNLLLPARPKDRQGQELFDFVCPYCGIFKHLRTDRAWRKHIMRDLAPYVCTYEKCTEPDQMFDNRDAWFSHESQHYSAYFCGIQSHPPHDNFVSFRDHMTSIHSTSISHDGDTSKMEIFLRRVPRLDGQCNLCAQPTNHLKHHIGRHLERIALFALPRNHAPDDAEAEQLEDYNASVGNVQGSDRRSSQTDRLLLLNSDASSTGVPNVNSGTSELRDKSPTPLQSLMNDIPLSDGSEGKLPLGLLERLVVQLPGVIPGGNAEQPEYNANRMERLNNTDPYYVVFNRIRASSTWPAPDAEFDPRTLLHTYYLVATESIRKQIPMHAEGEIIGDIAVNYQVSCFIETLQHILEHESASDVVLTWLKQLAVAWEQYRNDSYHLEADDVPEVVQEENWNAIKPELGPLPAVVPTSPSEALPIPRQDGVSSAPAPVTDFTSQQDKLYVLVLGPSGPGKSSFIRRCLGNEPVDQGHTASATEHHIYFEGRVVCLVIIPDFHDLADDIHAFLSLSQWLYDLGRAPVSLAVLIFLERGSLTNHPTIEINFKIFKAILGDECYRSITFVTNLTPSAKQSLLEVETANTFQMLWLDLIGNDPPMSYQKLWTDFIRGGAQAHRISETYQAARDLLKRIENQSRQNPIGDLQLQREFHSFKWSLIETEAGLEVLSALRKSHTEIENYLNRMKAEGGQWRARTILLERQQEQKKKAQDLLLYDVRQQSKQRGLPTSQDLLMVLPHGIEPNIWTFGHIYSGPVLRIADILGDGRAPSSSAPSSLIWGPPGIGKTHLAMDYMWRYRTEYTGGMLWIDCSSRATAFECFRKILNSVKIASDQNLDDKIQQLRLWLQYRQKWLVIFDNLNHSFNNREIHSFWYMIWTHGTGRAIFTTRDRNFENLRLNEDNKCLAITLEGMDKHDSMQLILDKLSSTTIPTKEEQNGAERIYEKTDGLPLFLHFVIAMLQNEKMPLDAPELWPWVAHRLTPLFRTISKGLSRESLNLLRVWSYWQPGINITVPKLYNLNVEELGFYEFQHSIAELLQNGMLEEDFRHDFDDDSVGIRVLRMCKSIQQIVSSATRAQETGVLIGDGHVELPWVALSVRVLCKFHETDLSITTEDIEDLRAFQLNAAGLLDALLDHDLHAGSKGQDAVIDEERRKLESWVGVVDTELRSRMSEDDEQLEHDYSIISDEAHGHVELPKDPPISLRRYSDDPIFQQGPPIPELVRRFSDDVNAQQPPLIRLRRYSDDLPWHQDSSDDLDVQLEGLIRVRTYDDEPEIEQGGDRFNESEAIPSSSSRRSHALRAIFQGTQSNTATAGPLQPMPTLTGDTRLTGAIHTERAVRSSSPASEVRSSLTALNRSVSGTIAQGEILRSENEPAILGTGLASAALRHSLNVQTKRKGKQPARQTSPSGSERSRYRS